MYKNLGQHSLLPRTAQKTEQSPANQLEHIITPATMTLPDTDTYMAGFPFDQSPDDTSSPVSSFLGQFSPSSLINQY